MTHTVDAPPSSDALELVGPARFVDSSPWPRVMPPEGEELSLVTELTDAELSEALRPVILRDGHEYTVEAHPDDFLPTLRSTDADRRTPSFAPIRRAADEHDRATVESGIIGQDNRVERRNNTEYPWSTVAYLPLGGSYRGTATMIGESTALTAAHVVHNGTNWLTLPNVAPGTDRQDPNPMPFGSFGRYNITIPNGWINNNGGDARYDYAVIEFSGYGDYPGRASGWKGLWVAPDNVVTGFVNVYGHPSDKSQPQIWGNGGNGIVNGQYINFFMDAWYGDSGAGLYAYNTDGWPYVIGVLRGAAGAIGDNSKPNTGRRMTRDVFDFIKNYSAL